MVIDFKDKVAVVTGGAGGIGIACVRNLLESHAKVAIVDASEKALDAAKEELGICGNYRCFQVDITKVEEIENCISEIRKELGEIEILVQTAGLMRSQSGWDMTPQEWDFMFSVNTKGMFFVMQQVVRQSMHKTGGAIVNFASMAGIRGMQEAMASPHYSASKGAVVAMSMQAATEWAKYGIRCNAVAPGGVLTKAMEKLNFSEGMLDPIPLRRLSSPEDIANGVVFLVSEKAAMITGQTLVIDGGSSIVGY